MLPSPCYPLSVLPTHTLCLLLDMSTRELEAARREHRRLDKQIAELDRPKSVGAPAIQAEVKVLKRHKLGLKVAWDRARGRGVM